MIENLTFAESISLHINNSMELALSSERHPLWNTDEYYVLKGKHIAKKQHNHVTTVKQY